MADLAAGLHVDMLGPVRRSRFREYFRPLGAQGLRRQRNAGDLVDATYTTYTTTMSDNAMPLPYEVQEMTTTEARKHLPELVNMAAYGHVTTVLTRDGRRLARIVPEQDAWVYSPAWQEKLQEAEADLAAGRVQRFGSDEDFLDHLDAIDGDAEG
jgi:antitoxin (DNA-binding transcriptional repressor) of toxin-antitoxin stability system